jgi:hypothetical protein
MSDITQIKWGLEKGKEGRIKLKDTKLGRRTL